jgi:hypothetical protein
VQKNLPENLKKSDLQTRKLSTKRHKRIVEIVGTRPGEACGKIGKVCHSAGCL